MPKATAAETAPIMMVYMADKYHFALVTKLLPNPKTKRKKAPITITAAVNRPSGWILCVSAAIMGTKGIKPKRQKLKNVIIEFLTGFS